MPSLEVLSRTQRIVVLPNTSVSIVKEGPTGPQGIQGLMGIQGLPGIDGEDGMSPEVLQYEPAAEYTAGDKGVMILGVDTFGNYSAIYTEAGALKVTGDFAGDVAQYEPATAYTAGDKGVAILGVDGFGNYSAIYTEDGALKVTGDFANDGLTNTELRAAPIEMGIHGWDTANWEPIYGQATNVDGLSPNVPSLFTLANLAAFDGTDWNRVRGSIANGVEVDVTRLPPVTLDAASLAALENTTVTIDAGSLAALETINVSNIAGTEYAEDTAHASGAAGILPLAVRRDADTTLADTTGDYAPLQVDASGKLKVVGALTDAQLRATPIAVTGAGGGVQFAEDIAAVSGDLGTFILAMRHDADTATVGTDGDYSALHTDASGKLKVTGGTSPATVGTNTTVANAIADGQVVAASAGRKHVSIFNDDTYGTGAVVNIALGFTASATAFTVKLPPQGLYEVPEFMAGLEIRRYSSAATGNLRVTAGS